MVRLRPLFLAILAHFLAHFFSVILSHLRVVAVVRGASVVGRVAAVVARVAAEGVVKRSNLLVVVLALVTST